MAHRPWCPLQVINSWAEINPIAYVNILVVDTSLSFEYYDNNEINGITLVRLGYT